MAKAKTPLQRVQGKLEKVSGDGKGVLLNDTWYNYSKDAVESCELPIGTEVDITFKNWKSADGKIERNYIETLGKSDSTLDKELDEVFGDTKPSTNIQSSTKSNKSSDEARQESIVRQSSLKSAVQFSQGRDLKLEEVFNIAEAMYDWVEKKDKDDFLDEPPF
tara:strand:- start:8296 stop:8784 length:489 start_codon:yes stop_codon:yes gene_type:complete